MWGLAVAAFFFEYGLFFAKVLTVLVAVLIAVGFVASQRHERRPGDGRVEVRRINDVLEDLRFALREHLLDPDQIKREEKTRKAREKAERKARRKEAKMARKRLAGRVEPEAVPDKPSLFLLNFEGDIRASANENLRREITAVLAVARPGDEVVVKLESPGGMVHSYGLAASQLDRIVQAKVQLVVCVDKVAASGGYMMACVANRIVAAPFAVLGSIGVVAQLPNVHRLLKKNDIDFELLTAGQYKRTLTVFGENTDEGRQKFIEELEETHVLFKEFVSEHRPQVDIDQIATGETWYGRRALGMKLIDEVSTSDDYLIKRVEEVNVYDVRFVEHKSLRERLGMGAAEMLDRVAVKWWDRLTQSRWMV
ncbi:MAG: protease SohB [Pseudomonadota bacterium]